MRDPHDHVISLPDFCRIWKVDTLSLGVVGPNQWSSPNGQGKCELGRRLEIEVRNGKINCRLDGILESDQMSSHWGETTLQLGTAAGLPALYGSIEIDRVEFKVQLMLLPFGPNGQLLQCRYHKADDHDHRLANDLEILWHDGMWHAPG